MRRHPTCPHKPYDVAVVGGGPPELRALGRVECAKYGVEFVSGIVDEAINETGELFNICLRDGTMIESHRILLAIGIRDFWPDIPGLERCYGESVHVCPDCSFVIANW